MEPDELVGPGQAAEIVGHGTTRQQISMWADRGLIKPAFRTALRGKRKFRRADVEALRDRLIAGDLPSAS